MGPILTAEIGNNDHYCDLGTQLNYLAEHLREHGHWGDAYALKTYRGPKAPDSKYETNPVLNVNEFDRVIQNLINLLLSGRVSFGIGERQSPFNPPHPEPLRKEYGFVLYANINNHGISNLLSPSGKHTHGGSVKSTDYIRIVFRFMDRVRMDLGSLGLPNLQLIIITMFPENPASNGLCDSILPNGVDTVGNPMGVALGALPLSPAPDNRIPAVQLVPPSP
ncbi:MAG: hypothetical protein LBD60_01845 [Puniceicoccales bacterium]|jgi:hypothetical protein|nr:hypothetical protein [Puniceicoccales bacterium]